MFDPEQTSITDISTVEKTSTSIQHQPNVPSLSKDSEVASDARDFYLEIEGAQEVFYRGAYVTRIPLLGADILVGRRDVMAGYYPDVDLAMYRKQDSSISRKHLRIYRDLHNVWYVEDLCNHNATFINSYDNPLNHERRELKPDDRIIISSSIAMVFKFAK